MGVESNNKSVSIGIADCRDKIVLADQQTAGDWMGLRDGLLLRLQEMGVKGLIVVEQDDCRGGEAILVRAEAGD